ncbi:vomeronasal type-1 receptor 4-like [Dromiciops gliroides]|uniref:vomeronasal type-1 receptor 4-like n=1 Tax=Dromiciops gliroides TaxID=33562 RepID=UPI001CC56137|nr:vomeronasal type-1 receptor 4-like [Dromiciops gliroides]
MLTSNVCIGIFLLLQTTTGILANCFLLSLYILNFRLDHKLRPLNLILTQLILTNITMLVSIGSPEILQAFEIRNFLDNVGCKVIFFLYRITQGLSICFTCLLCSFQAITISPSGSTLSKLKTRIPEQISTLSLFCWILNILIEIPVPMFVREPKSTTNNTYAYTIIYCSIIKIIDIYFIMTTLRNVLCVGLMFWTSGYMVFLLHRHHHQVQNIHSTNFSSRASPEVRATQTILLLMGIFVCFYLLHSITLMFLTYLGHNRYWLTISAILSLCFPTFSPFVLLPRTPKHSCILWGRKVTDSQIVLKFEYKVGRVISPVCIHGSQPMKVLVTRKNLNSF